MIDHEYTSPADAIESMYPGTARYVANYSVRPSNIKPTSWVDGAADYYASLVERVKNA